MIGAAPAIAEGDATVAVQRLGPPDVEARCDALLRQMLASPGDLDLASGLATADGGVIRRDYDDPDPTIDPFASEKDTVFWTRGALVLPVAETWAVVPQVEYRNQDSNYDIRNYDDLTALLGVQKRF